MKKEELSIGMPVHYVPVRGKKQNGMVKEFHPLEPNRFVFVVYGCGGDWDNYKNYTGALTEIAQLEPGWYVDAALRRIKYISEAFSMQPITMNVTEYEPASNGEKMNCCKFITLEKVTFGEKDEQMMYCGYNFYAERIFQFIYNSVNVGYFPEGFKS
jgi:hypothetical protein